MDNNKIYAIRLKPGEDLRKGIETIVKEWMGRAAGKWKIAFDTPPILPAGNLWII